MQTDYRSSSNCSQSTNPPAEETDENILSECCCKFSFGRFHGVCFLYAYAYKKQTPGNHPKENLQQHYEHGESLKSRILSEIPMFYSDILYVQSKLIATKTRFLFDAYYEEEYRGRGDVV
jgi:hypothetical protein